MKTILRSLIPLLAGTSALACPQYDAAVAAVNASDAAAATPLYDQIMLEPTCDDAFRGWLATFLAQESFRAGMDEGQSADARRAAYEASLTYEPHWRTWAAMGRLAWDGQDYTTAAAELQLAINALVDGPADHLAAASEIAEIYQLASAAVALSDSVVPIPVTRSGSQGGLFATNIRGYEVTEIPLPITFAYGTDDFDTSGAAYAQMLADHLVTFAPESIALTGHTDPIGGDEFNQVLSEQRAAALADFLRANGYEGEIVVGGVGRTQIPPPPPGIVEGSEDHYRIARRVTFIEN
jgi:outer membrane protein OmpA-like peptidoglycan-associated protein